MAFVYKDRVRETTTTTGTGTLTLAGAVTRYQSFSAVGNGNNCYYCIEHVGTGDWEVGKGTYTSAGTTLSRTTVLASSNGGAAVIFGAGTKEVYCVAPAEASLGRMIQRERANNVSVATGTTVLPLDATVPQNTEGDQYLSQAITPVSAGNLLHIRAQLFLSPSVGDSWITAALFQDSIAGALVSIPSYISLAFGGSIYTLDYWMTAGTVAATTFKVRAGVNVAGTTTFNGTASAELLGGTMDSYIEITEWTQ